MAQIYADVILPLPLHRTFTYIVPEQFEADIQRGCRVLVPFGRKKFYTGIVVGTHTRKPTEFEAKEIADLLDSTPIVRYPQLKLWDWIADYYLCSVGEVFKAALPAGLKLESETSVRINPEFEESTDGELKERERIVLDFISARDKVSLLEISKATGFKNVESVVTSLIDKDAVFVSENVITTYRPKTVTCVDLACYANDNETPKSYFELVRNAKKQEQVLLAFFDLSHRLQRGQQVEVTKESLMKRADASPAIIKAMEKKGILRIYKKSINRFSAPESNSSSLPELSEAQHKAYREIFDSFKEHDITLLHGVTSSGKTEIYINIIEQYLHAGKQVLFLVPEIALTTQLTHRLGAVFGNKLIIYHSKFSDNERVDVWKQLLTNDEPRVIIGVRSSVFLPFSSLGLVIVDEEHEASFKQYDPAPRYNARNVAMILARYHGAKTLLGSATPSIESYYNATQGKYGLVNLTERYGDAHLPDVQVVDMKLERKKKLISGPFSSILLGETKHAIADGKQAILFQNRRGYSPTVECTECAWVPKCINCDVSLTYHKHNNMLQCHHCGYSMPMPNLCQACGQPTLKVVGYGTERIEDDVESRLPDASILRMDLDTTRNKNGYDDIINQFSSGKAQVLVGTQMVTKGLDFGGVSVVGVINADTMINFPNFRANERAFNMLEQVAGRAGRKQASGKVIIQTSNPTHPVILDVVNHDYISHYNREIEERRQFSYPPFTKIINIYIKHRDIDTVTELAVRYSMMLRAVFSSRVLGPESPLVSRIQNMHIKQITLKMELAASMPKVKTILRDIYENIINADSRMKSAILYYDVDPL
ncbi:MAG: primosomal protein N' [Muribaculaceae bacterium]|nr:primosomal protein N' [Muribaculaceae bacterium]